MYGPKRGFLRGALRPAFYCDVKLVPAAPTVTYLKVGLITLNNVAPPDATVLAVPVPVPIGAAVVCAKLVPSVLEYTAPPEPTATNCTDEAVTA